MDSCCAMSLLTEPKEFHNSPVSGVVPISIADMIGQILVGAYRILQGLLPNSRLLIWRAYVAEPGSQIFTKCGRQIKNCQQVFTDPLHSQNNPGKRGEYCGKDGTWVVWQGEIKLLAPGVLHRRCRELHTQPERKVHSPEMRLRARMLKLPISRES
jgi:hypothetical protein